MSKKETTSLTNDELAESISYGKGQISLLQAMITKHSAEMVVIAIRGGSSEEQNLIKHAIDQHLSWLEDTIKLISALEGELEHRKSKNHTT